MRKKLLVAAEIDRGFLDLVRGDSRFDVDHSPVRSAEELAAIVADAEVLVTRAHIKVPRAVIEVASRLELIAQGTSGIDNIDLAAARERAIGVVHLPGVNANAVAELVIGCIVSMTRTIPFYTREVARGTWQRDGCASRHEMRQYRLGIVGVGEVGTRVARLAGAFGMTVAGYDPYITDADFAARQAARSESLSDLLAASDVLTLHVPLTAETRRMIGRDEIRSLPRGSFLVSSARGEVLHQTAALEALEDGHLAGLALDVYDPEPPAAPFPDDPRLILTPHIAGCSHECRQEIGPRLYQRIVGYLF